MCQRLRRIGIFVLGLSILMGSAYADGKRRSERLYQIQILGSSLGAGGAMGLHLTSWLFVGGEFFGRKSAQSVDGIEADYDFRTKQAYLRIYPFSSLGFFVQGGAGSRNWSLQGTGAGYIGETTTTYTSSETIKIEWRGPTTNLGVGWNWMSDSPLAAGWGLIAVKGGKPRAYITDHTGSATSEQIAEEEANYEKKYSSYATVLVAQIFIGYTF